MLSSSMRRAAAVGAVGASCAFVLLALMATQSPAPGSLLGAQKASWDAQEASLWRPRTARSTVLAETSKAVAAAHGEAKLKQIVGSLRKNHLLRSRKLRQIATPKARARQPHFGPGKVVELSQSPNGMRVFEGRMLCAEGEKTCVHPCEAFYTITGEEPPEDCKCTCTSPNPHSFYKAGSVICNCPGSPIAPENDMYPYPPGEGPMAAIEAAQAAQSAPVSTASAEDGAGTPSLSEHREPAEADNNATPEDVDAEMPNEQEAAGASEAEAAPDAAQPAMRGMPTALAGYPYYGAEHAMQLERDIDARLGAMGVKIEPLERMPSSQMSYAAQGQGPYAGGWAYRGGKAPQGLYVGAGPAFLPPDGDYPGGSTGIPMDGYLAFETGYGAQPYHGTLSPMQEAGIADRAPTSSLRQREARSRRVRSVKTALGEPK